jgi:hypothetical protein
MKKYIFYFLSILSVATFTSCEEDATSSTGINFVTFEADPSKSYVIDEGSTFNTEFKVFTASNVGSDTTLDLTVTTSLDAANYTVPATVTIPANSNEGTISVTIIENNLDKINGETLSIELSSPDGFFGGATELSILVNVFCPSQIAGSYAYSDGNGKAATIIAGSGVNNFILSGDNAFGTNYAIRINDQCGAITVTGGDIEDNFGLAVSGTGTVMANGDIVMTYTAEGQFTDRTMTLVKQ